MRVTADIENGRLIFSFSRDEDDDDQLQALRFTMTDVEVYFDLGSEFTDLPHPDLLGIATIMLCNPFVGEELYLPRPVSKQFHDLVSSVISRYRVAPTIDEGVEAIAMGTGSRPGLAFSGGADSSAALALMPPRTVPVFLNRPIIGNSVYDSDAPLAICDILAGSGYETQIVSSNLEYLRDPIGFPTDLANSIPALLLSRHLGLDSISFGTIMESGYGLGHEHFVDYGNSAHWRFFGTLFRAVGVELTLPVLGVSEVNTAVICESAPVASISQSCIRGGHGNPCMGCWKCFRKELLVYSLGFRDAPDIQRMMKSNEVQVRLSSFPISHENVIIFSLQRIELDLHPYLKPLADKLDMGLDLSFMEYWFPKSIDHVPDKYRFGIRDKILQYMDPMTYEHELALRSWNMVPHLNSAKAKTAQERLTSSWQDLT